ncbi:MAG: ubiquitin-like protein Pup [Yaniella sp.]|uniref:ubiquitin-like protein Pup n=1 Tax=Yaniella sp. TaxID=2773929 RepID=UPI0026479F88|nr:ubiquitin-like protein Pup [Yaniella sp.]MDN5705143.1 ubiquitin-like protein Pup [Yaniella sp.]MDN5730584.1 ubiquitin-like protein Pup [Yaniella sp.]MDN5814917.1 ubiquitin-like protein Pup [Yaniella sp.]MDN5817330.1 ubiquitin-like protein Pup [Yaniella sp.]MDN5837496.1 ubiquitin-like protein Pup [Yaniella sp.]
MAQGQQRPSHQQRDEDQHIPDPLPEGTPSPGSASAQTSDLDSLLDEIDDVLEVNAEEFVQGFVQKGGQ